MNFVKTVRAVELILGIPVPGVTFDMKLTTTNFTAAMSATATAMGNATSAGASGIFNSEVIAALQEAAPILVEMALELSIPTIFNFASAAAPVHSQREPLVTKYVSILLIMSYAVLTDCV